MPSDEKLTQWQSVAQKLSDALEAVMRDKNTDTINLGDQAQIELFNLKRNSK